MDINKILGALEHYTGRFPKEAMQSAIEQREAITPELLSVVKNVADCGEEFASRKGYTLHSYATYLLAQFRETRAFPSLVKIVSLPGELPSHLYGDTIDEALSRILGSVYAGDPALLQGLAEGELINEYVRAAALDSFVVLERSGQMSRDQVVSYFRSLFHEKLPRSYSYAWTGLIRSCAALPAPELLQEVIQAFEEEWTDLMMGGLHTLERKLMSDEKTIRAENHNRFSIITDAIGEMEWWAAFHREPSTASKGEKLKVGRNLPCPCGSGKKFKKCCENKR